MSKERAIEELKLPIYSAFDIKWDFNANEIMEMSKVAINVANETINEIILTQGPRTYDNTVKPLAKFEGWIASKTTPISFLA